jgi:hypothetical protein
MVVIQLNRPTSGVLLVIAVAVLAAALMPSASGAPFKRSVAKPLYIQLFRTFSETDGRLSNYQHPSRIRLLAGGMSVTFGRLTWSGWGSQRVVATGDVTACDQLGCSTESVKITASRLVSCVRYRIYARVVASRIPLYGVGAAALPAQRECLE